MRLKILKATIYVGFVILIFSLGRLQLLRGFFWRERSEHNRIRLVSIPAPRGEIFDRKDRLLAKNRLAFALAVIPQELETLTLTRKNEVLRALSGILKIKESEISRRVAESKAPPFVAVTIATDINKKDALLVEEKQLPAVLILTSSSRSYPQGKTACHLLGYLGERSPVTERRPKTYGWQVRERGGISGVESSFDSYLRGVSGGRQIEVDNHGRKRRLLGEKMPISGHDLYLTIDIEIQELCEKELGGRPGAVVVMNPKDGEIYALASSPGFDPNHLTPPRDSREVEKLFTSSGGCLLNRALRSFPPGSVFKVVVAAAGLAKNVISPSDEFVCRGTYPVGRRSFSCWDTFGHGSLNLEEALARSCNIFFYQLGERVGVDSLEDFAQAFGFGRPTGVELPEESAGLVPGRRWKKRSLAMSWLAGDTANLSIGQGWLLITPLQAAKLIASIANEGRSVSPHLLRGSGVPSGIIKAWFFRKLGEGRLREAVISAGDARTIKEGLIKTVESGYGTGNEANVARIEIAGKTGTAQCRGRPHGWFIGFAPADNPEVALAVFLEHGGKGGGEPARIARVIFQKALTEERR